MKKKISEIVFSLLNICKRKKISSWVIFVKIIVDSAPYISELLAGIEDEAVRQSISDFLILRSKLSVGDLIGKGNNVIPIITQSGISHTDKER